MVKRIKRIIYIYIYEKLPAVSIPSQSYFPTHFLPLTPIQSNFTLTGSQKSSLLNGGTVAEDDQAGPHMASGHAHGGSMNWPTSGHDRGEYLYLQLTY